MTRFKVRSLIVVVALSAIADAAYGQICVTSDSIKNTACGTGALPAPAYPGNNTALGFEVLYSNTTGSYNTAIGIYALYANTAGVFNVALGGND
jgi:hypothetical protein